MCLILHNFHGHNGQKSSVWVSACMCELVDFGCYYFWRFWQHLEYISFNSRTHTHRIPNAYFLFSFFWTDQLFSYHCQIRLNRWFSISNGQHNDSNQSIWHICFLSISFSLTLGSHMMETIDSTLPYNLICNWRKTRSTEYNEVFIHF